MITISTPMNDKNRVEDSVTLTAHSGSVGNSTEQASVTIKVEDDNVLPAVAMMVVDDDGDPLEMQPTSVPEGESVMVAVMPLDDDGDAAAAAEELTVALTPTGTADAAELHVGGNVHHPGRRQDKQCRRNRGAVGRGCRHGIAHVRRRRIR